MLILFSHFVPTNFCIKPQMTSLPKQKWKRSIQKTATQHPKPPCNVHIPYISYEQTKAVTDHIKRQFQLVLLLEFKHIELHCEESVWHDMHVC